jgi:hypothetical protein
MRLLLDKARHCIGFDLQILAHDVLLAGARLNVALIFFYLAALHLCEQFPPVHMPLRLNVVNHYAW